MRKCQLSYTSMKQHVPYGAQQDFIAYLKTSTIALNFEMNVASRTQPQLSNRQRTETNLSVPHWGNNCNTVTYIWKLLATMNGAEWMKRTCHKWSRGRNFSPSMPGDRYLKHSPQKRPPGEVSGSIIWYNALARPPEVLLYWHLVCACAVLQ